MQNFPFPEGSVMEKQFPDGFDEEGMYLNGLATWALDHSALFEGSKNPGVDATIEGVEGITGLKMNYWAMVNLEGFKDLVDAVGGVELNVRQRIPVGLPSDSFFRYIEPGTRTLNGMDTLWFARARHDSDDYSRMARQKCVMSAMLQQVSPQVALRNFEKIAGAGSAMVSTNVPRGEVDRFVDLALKAKSQKIASLSLVPPMVNTANPDIDLVHAKVAAAVAKAEGRAPEKPVETAEAAPADTESSESTDTTGDEATTDAADGAADQGAAAPPPAPTSPSTPPAVTGGSLGSLSTGYAANQSEDVGAVC
jgi:LCP family protein required for cell wall assembly